MSYILDALKKSEQERQRGTVPDLLRVQEEVLQLPKRPSRWRYAGIAAMVVVAGVSVWMLLPSMTGGPAVTPLTPQQSPERMATLGQERDTPASVPAASVAGTRSGEPRLPAAAVRGGPVRERREPVDGMPVSGRTEPAPVSQDPVKPGLPVRQAVLPPADPDRIYNFKELPAALQKELPSFALSAFMYSSNPELRMVRINAQMMREGQELTAGIRLQEITTDGVILASQGYRFFIAMK